MRARRPRPLPVASLDGLLASFLTAAPPGFEFDAMRLQIFPISYFRSFLRTPTPLNAPSFSFLILQKTGSGTIEINGDVVRLRSRCAMFIHRGNAMSLRAVSPSVEGWVVIYGDGVLARAVDRAGLEEIFARREPMPLSSSSYRWIERACGLLSEQAEIERDEPQPVSEKLFGALLERIIGEGAGVRSPRLDSAVAIDDRFRRLVLEHATTEGEVSFYARELSVSASHLLRCVQGSSGRSPKRWILDVRLMEAQRHLRTSDAPIADVATACGFSEPSYFGRLFQRRFGMTPREYRRKAMQDLSG